jgi:hypothetical protein
MSSSSAFNINLGTSDPDAPFEFEHNPYPRSSANREEGLPLHYMSEDKTRRRVKAMTVSMYDQQEKEHNYGEYYDDEGKDVYSKLRPKSSRLSSGRLPQLPLPPPTSVVGSIVFFLLLLSTNALLDGIYFSKHRTPPTHHLHSSLLLDEIPQNWCIQCCHLG